MLFDNGLTVNLLRVFFWCGMYLHFISCIGPTFVGGGVEGVQGGGRGGGIVGIVIHVRDANWYATQAATPNNSSSTIIVPNVSKGRDRLV